MAGSLVGVVMGSSSDRETMRRCVEQLRAPSHPEYRRALVRHRADLAARILAEPDPSAG